MALSPNYGWAEPDNSSLVKNGAQDIRALGDAIDTSVWNVGYGQAAKNKLINSNFAVWQRGTSFSNPAASSYTADRFFIDYDGTGATRTISQQTFTPGTAPVAGYEGQFFYRFAQTVQGTNSFDIIIQPIEDVRTFAGQTVTFSFWAKCDTNRTLTADCVQVFGSGGSSPVNITAQTISATSSWQRFSLTFAIPSISGKTLGAGNHLRVRLYITSATTFTIDTWGWQLEYGSKATPFQTATGTIQGELALAQRYYWRATAKSLYEPFGVGAVFSTTQAQAVVKNPVDMRVAPTSVDFSTLALSDSGAGIRAVTALTMSQGGGGNNLLTVTIGTTSLTAGNASVLTANNSTSAFIGFNAEL